MIKNISIKICILSLLLVLIVFSIVFAYEINDNYLNQCDYVILDISNASLKSVENFKLDTNVYYWCELDDVLFVTYKENSFPNLPNDILVKKHINVNNKFGIPMLAIKIGKFSPLDEYSDDINVIYKTLDESHIIFQAPLNVLNELSKKESNHFKIEALNKNIRAIINEKFIQVPDIKSKNTVTVDIKRLSSYIKTFEEFKTRYTYTQNYIEAANFALNEFKKLGYDAKLVEYLDGSKKQYNIVAQKDFNFDGKFYIIGAHLDSTSSTPTENAPGADDNASGSAGVLEVANIISKYNFANKVRFVLFAGEELGLKGSRAYVSHLKTTGEINNVLGMINLDMIGYDVKPPLSSFWQFKQEFHPFVDNFLSVAKEGNKLKYRISYNVWGSDHVSFTNANIPSFLLIEDEYGSNPNYHKITDKLETLNLEMLNEIVRVIAQGLVNLLSK